MPNSSVERHGEEYGGAIKVVREEESTEVVLEDEQLYTEEHKGYRRIHAFVIRSGEFIEYDIEPSDEESRRSEERRDPLRGDEGGVGRVGAPQR